MSPESHCTFVVVGVASTVSLAAVEAGKAVDSLEALFRSHAPTLVRIARMFVDYRSAAEDLVQEAFIRFHRSRHRLRDDAAAGGYLRATVLNLARDHNRRGLVSLRHRDAHPAGTEEPPPDTAVVLAEDQNAVIEAVRDLPHRQRDCIVLRHYLELSYDEIATTLGISVNSVKTHLKRGSESLRITLEDRR